MKTLLTIFVLLLLALNVPAQVIYPPASQAEVSAGTSTTKFVSPATLRGAGTVTNGQFSLPYGIPRPVAWWSARSFAQSNHWSAITSWPDVGPNGYTLSSSAASAGNVDLYGFYGNPGVYFTFNAGSTMGYTNTAMLTAHPELNTNLTIFIVWKNNSAPATAWTLLNDDNNGMEFAYQAVQGNRYGAGAATWYAAGSGYSQVLCFETTEGYNLPDISSFRYNGTTKGYSATVNGHQIYSGATVLYPSIDTKNPLAMGGNFYVGSLFGRTQSFQGEVAEILVFNVALTDAQMVSVNDYLGGIYRRKAKNLVLDGDSITQSQEASAGQDLIKMVHTNLVNWDVDLVALPGNSSLAQFANQTNWVTSPKRDNGQNWVAYLTGANDFGTSTPMTIAQVTTQLPITESNILIYCTNAHNWGWKVLISTLPSNLRMETNNARAQLNAWIATNGVSDGVVDYSGLIPQIGAYQSCTNGNYFQTNGGTPQLHPLSAAYALMAPVLANALNQSVAGNQFSGNGAGLTNLQGGFNTTGTYTNFLSATGFTNQLGFDVRVLDLQGTSIYLTNIVNGRAVSIGTISVNNDFLTLHTNEAIKGTGMSGIVWQ